MTIRKNKPHEESLGQRYYHVTGTIESGTKTTGTFGTVVTAENSTQATALAIADLSRHHKNLTIKSVSPVKRDR